MVSHVHSDHSHDGQYSLEEIAAAAEAAGVDVVLLSDTAVARWEYGPRLLPRALRPRRERRSVSTEGPAAYLAAVAALQRRHPSVIFIPGVEAAAYYRWTGGWRRGWTIHDWNRHMIVAGLMDEEALRGLPVQGNGAADWDRHADSTPWEPYRALARYARERGAVAFWAHPQALEYQREIPVADKISARTAPYPEALRAVPEAAGFAALRTGPAMARPGAEWDTALGDYCRGLRPSPPWAFAELDFKSRGSHVRMGTAYMVVDVQARTAAAVIAALREGKFYSMEPSSGGFVLRRFEVKGGSAPIVAAEIAPLAPPSVPAPPPAAVTLVRDGEAVWRRELPLPAAITWADPAPKAGCSYYRLIVEDSTEAVLLSNPVFK